MALLTPEIADIFRWQIDENGLKRCKREAGLAKFAIATVLGAASGTVGLLMPDQSSKKAQKSMDQLKFLVGQTTGAEANAVNIVFGGDFEAKICAKYPQPSANEEEEVLEYIHNEIKKGIVELQKRFETSLMTVVHIDGTGESGE
ncbi:uncharacterized protein KY384_007947 [Bacidia gigantensis]|uniref:uncharacterized protein n=1 Tax=Bacidia gigantensis TaxID=2732470 RepID=UPI001D05A951|nr:uncharacterized protein KY384_007947 [Bacidia gigantensis]KAG8527793.1 hypothetical protein KY384_007947 [Bacidia gigantensis]